MAHEMASAVDVAASTSAPQSSVGVAACSEARISKVEKAVNWLACRWRINSSKKKMLDGMLVERERNKEDIMILSLFDHLDQPHLDTMACADADEPEYYSADECEGERRDSQWSSEGGCAIYDITEGDHAEIDNMYMSDWVGVDPVIGEESPVEYEINRFLDACGMVTEDAKESLGDIGSRDEQSQGQCRNDDEQKDVGEDGGEYVGENITWVDKCKSANQPEKQYSDINLGARLVGQYGLDTAGHLMAAHLIENIYGIDNSDSDDLESRSYEEETSPRRERRRSDNGMRRKTLMMMKMMMRVTTSVIGTSLLTNSMNGCWGASWAAQLNWRCTWSASPLSASCRPWRRNITRCSLRWVMRYMQQPVPVAQLAFDIGIGELMLWPCYARGAACSRSSSRNSTISCSSCSSDDISSSLTAQLEKFSGRTGKGRGGGSELIRFSSVIVQCRLDCVC
mmetsp:Transcript_56835/g.144070  ORF Transcript_56835/g.144070 Transcript_56835/m.144070 type:complete len:454 (-) Transcript_56835:341-1702(-)